MHGVHTHHRRCLVLQADQVRYAAWVYRQPVVTDAMRWHLRYDWACAWSRKAAANMHHVVRVFRRRREAQAHAASLTPKPLNPSITTAYPSAMTTLGWCISGLESTHDFSINTGNGYYGGFQFDSATWLSAQSAMGVYYASRADLASEAQQTAVFRYWYAGHPTAWPNTGPACGG